MRKFLVFDLDGTLANTLTDIAISLNAAMEQCGYAPLTVDATRALIGHSVYYMCENALPENERHRAQEVCDAFNAHYYVHCVDHTRPYLGLCDLLQRLNAKGYTLAVVSNKPHREAVKVCSQLFDARLFSLVLGRVPELTIKPDPAPLNYAVKRLGLTLNDMIYIGDSEVDVRFAKNAGVPEIAVSWGFRTPEELLAAGAETIASTPKELEEAIERLGGLA